MGKRKSKKKRAFFDRRSGQDRRKAYNIDYFLEGGLERRNSANGDRRNRPQDRRRDWIKINRWSSLHVEENNADSDESEDSPDTK
jgi:hypothetical protein